MGRNDNYHHHKSSHSKHGSSSSKQHQHRQHQQHSSSSSYQVTRPEPFDNQCIPAPFQVPPFIQPPPLISQYNPAYQQQTLPQNLNQQLYFNQVQQNLLPPSLLMQNNLPAPQQAWFNQSPQSINFNLAQAGSARPNEQSISTEALNRLQLPASQITETGIIPNTPYYELPAGLMVPLIPHNQMQYKPLNPADLRLPLPKFPDENFLKSIDAYYGTDGKTRDSVGWDREFIDTFISQKEALAGQ